MSATQSKEQRMLLSVALYSGIPLTEDECDEERVHENDVHENDVPKESSSWSLGGVLVVSATLLTAFSVLLVGAALSGTGCSMTMLRNTNSSPTGNDSIPYQLRGSTSTLSYAAEKNVPWQGIPNAKKPCVTKTQQASSSTNSGDAVTEMMKKVNEAALQQFVQESNKVMEKSNVKQENEVNEVRAEDAIATKTEVAMPMDIASTAAVTTPLLQKKPCDKNKTPASEFGEQPLGSSISSSSVSELNPAVESSTVEVALASEKKPKMPCGRKKATPNDVAATSVSNKMMTTAIVEESVPTTKTTTVETAVDPLPNHKVVVLDSEDEVDSPTNDDGSLDGGALSKVAYDDDSWLIDNVDKKKELAENELMIEDLPTAKERLAELNVDDEQDEEDEKP